MEEAVFSSETSGCLSVLQRYNQKIIHFIVAPKNIKLNVTTSM
jgi:hypothetical protein